MMLRSCVRCGYMCVCVQVTCVNVDRGHRATHENASDWRRKTTKDEICGGENPCFRNFMRGTHLVGEYLPAPYVRRAQTAFVRYIFRASIDRNGAQRWDTLSHCDGRTTVMQHLQQDYHVPDTQGPALATALPLDTFDC